MLRRFRSFFEGVQGVLWGVSEVLEGDWLDIRGSLEGFQRSQRFFSGTASSTVRCLCFLPGWGLSRFEGFRVVGQCDHRVEISQEKKGQSRSILVGL